MFKKLTILTVLLLVLTGSALLGRSAMSKKFVVEGDIATISMMLDLFEIENDRYPSTEEGLQALIKCPETLDPKAWQGPYLRRDPIDPWGNKYVYLYPGINYPDKFDLYSLGKDGFSKSGGNDLDDINSWNKQRPWREYYKSISSCPPASVRWYMLVILGLSMVIVGAIVFSVFNKTRRNNP